MKRPGLVVLLLVLFGALSLSAQSVGPAPGAAGVEAKFLTLELGLPLGYRLSDGAMVSGRAFALSVAVADNFSVGISTTQIGTTALTAYNALRLSYTVIPLLGTSVFVGQAGANTAAGLGFYSTIVQSKSAAGLGTGIRLRIDYLFDTTALSGGSVVFTTAILFGI
jgi:hypothetical protein